MRQEFTVDCVCNHPPFLRIITVSVPLVILIVGETTEKMYSLIKDERTKTDNIFDMGVFLLEVM